MRLHIFHSCVKTRMVLYNVHKFIQRIVTAKEDGSLWRLVNDDQVTLKSKMKTITVDGKLHLCLFALKDIGPGEEIRYNYRDSDWLWRSKISTETDPQLRLNDNIQQNCNHDLVSSVLSSLGKCAGCSGPFPAFRWIGVRCKGEYFVLINKNIFYKCFTIKLQIITEVFVFPLHSKQFSTNVFYFKEGNNCLLVFITASES
ncbi:uncharacterized protein LOC120788085 [Xiphias gladius]|uniref:uncharacterized protein LOC120788085 n=1 Tax=Xiphias gladius TaxID=8245 RepID=UPI001A996024|nr:uncharacterized protein LOC120788085 [Xiphias gladius]